MIQSLVWTCLLTFGLGSAAYRLGLVICSDAHGGNRVEWGCARTLAGECLPVSAAAQELANDGDPCGPHPCEDIPLRVDYISHLIALRLDVLPGVVPSFLAASVECYAIRVHMEGPKVLRPLLARPPDTAAHMRSVILLI